jgi:ATP-dependent Zn protease
MPTERVATTVKLAVAIVCLAYISLTATAFAAGSTAKPKFGDESLQAYDQQLAGGEVSVVRFNEKAHTMRVTLKDGRHLHVVYAQGTEPALRAALQAKGVSLPALKKSVVHHTLRYVAAGVLVVVILIAIGVLVVVRRRRREAQY